MGDPEAQFTRTYGTSMSVLIILYGSGGTGYAWPLRHLPCGLPSSRKRRFPRCGHFGDLSHGLHTCCLRLAEPVTRAPRKTRYRLVANLYRAGLSPARRLA